MRTNIPSRKILVVLLAVGLVGSTVAFATTSTLAPSHETDEQDSTYVRVVHASPDAPAVDVRVENETVLSNVSYGNVSDYLELEAGTYNVSIVTAGENETVVLDTNVTFEPRTVTTLAASGEVSDGANASFEGVLFRDDAFTPANNSSAISVVHLSPDAPAVDVTAANGSVVLAENVTFQNASDYVTVPAGNYTVEIRAANATNNGSVVATANVSLESGEAYSALALGYLDAENASADAPFEVALAEDATLTVQLPSADEPTNETTGNETTGNETTANETTGTETTGNETTTPDPDVTIPDNVTVTPDAVDSPPLP